MTLKMGEEDFWARVEVTTGCWQWRGKLNQGYGRFAGKQAHRVAYGLARGPIPDGMTLDHACHSFDPSCEGGDTCRHRACVNPAHLEPVLRAENIKRGRRWNLRKLRCSQGHPLVGDNLRRRVGARVTHRECRACYKLDKKANKSRRAKERMDTIAAARALRALEAPEMFRIDVPVATGLVTTAICVFCRRWLDEALVSSWRGWCQDCRRSKRDPGYKKRWRDARRAAGFKVT